MLKSIYSLLHTYEYIFKKVSTQLYIFSMLSSISYLCCTFVLVIRYIGILLLFRFTVRIFVYWPSYFWIIRHYISTWSRSCFTYWRRWTDKAAIWWDISQRFVRQSRSFFSCSISIHIKANKWHCNSHSPNFKIDSFECNFPLLLWERDVTVLWYTGVIGDTVKTV